MTDAELITYFEAAELPETLRIDRATWQYELRHYVEHYTNLLLQRPDDKNVRFWLLRIKKALDQPFAGQEIPRF